MRLISLLVVTRAHQKMRYPNVTRVDVSSYLFTYLPPNYDTPVLPKYFYVTRTCYISNGRRFTKSIFCVSLLSTFRVCSINYSFVCGFPIHTWNSANAEGPRTHCQLKSCKMLHKCSTYCIWKGLQTVNGLQGHSRLLPLLSFDRPCTIAVVYAPPGVILVSKLS